MMAVSNLLDQGAVWMCTARPIRQQSPSNKPRARSMRFAAAGGVLASGIVAEDVGETARAEVTDVRMEGSAPAHFGNGGSRLE